jgi:hypothetical protein
MVMASNKADGETGLGCLVIVAGAAVASLAAGQGQVPAPQVQLAAWFYLPRPGA